MKLILLLCLILSGCAPMPGGELFPEISQPADLEDIHITKTIGVQITTEKCGQALFDYNPKVFWANVLLNFGIPLGCAIVHHVDGVPVMCEVYAVADWDWIINHELRHCQGFKDSLY